MQLTARIIAYRISNGALAAKDLPKRIKFADWGDVESLKGTVRVNALTAERLPRTQRERGWDRVALDYEHNSLPGTPEYERSTEPRAVAAYGVVVCVPGDGLYLDDLQWTPHGEKYAREYCDLSMAPAQTSDGTVLGIHSVALCRHGAVPGVQFYSVNLNEGDGAMDWKKFLCQMLGKPETTSDEDLKKAFESHVSALCAEAIKKAIPDVQPIEARVAAVETASKDVVKIAALSAEVTTLTAKIAEVEKGIGKRDRDDILKQAAREGKVVALSAEAIGQLTVEQLKDHVSKIPVTVPVDQRTVADVTPHAADAGKPNTYIDVVAKACGVNPEDVKKQK